MVQMCLQGFCDVFSTYAGLTGAGTDQIERSKSEQAELSWYRKEINDDLAQLSLCPAAKT